MMKSGVVCYKKSCHKQITVAPSLSCWFCDNAKNTKCVGYTASTADAIARHAGLRFCCDACREVEDGLITFREMTKDFSALDTTFNNPKL